MNAEFSNRTFVVTGGTGALGRAVVGRLLEGGANVVAPWVLEAEVEDFPYRDRVRLEKVNLEREDEVSALYRSIDSLWGSIHCAGGFAMSPVEATPLEDFESMWRLNVATCFLCCREAIRRMRATGRGGRIVNVAARPAERAVGGMIAYAVSKSAVAALTRHLAEEVRDDAILVNAVAPSIMDTPGNRAAMPGADFDAWPKTEQVAETIAFLASPANALTSGALVPVYGRA